MTTIDYADLTFEVREAAADSGVAATLTGVAVPYGAQIAVSGIREQFAADAFDPAQVTGRPLFWRHGEMIGKVTDAVNTPDGLHVTAQIADTTLGRDAATLARMGGMGMSVGFTPTVNDTTTKGLVTRVKATLQELSITPQPAYADAGVATIREEQHMPETETVETEVSAAPEVREDTVTKDDLVAIQRQISTLRTPTTTEVHELAAYRTFGEYAWAVATGEVEQRVGLVDQITTDNPGLLPPNWASHIYEIINFGRPAVNAFGVQSAGNSGLEFNWPTFTGDLSAIVAKQAAEKTDVNSVKISFGKSNATLETYAAASDISYQVLMRSNPSYLGAHNEVMVCAYAVTTDKAFTAALITAQTKQVGYDIATDTDGSKFRAELFKASVAVETATGNPASIVLVASDVFLKLGGMTGLYPYAYGTFNASGTAQANSLNVNINGLVVTHDRNLPAGTILVSNPQAAKWIEDGPRFATQENVSKLGHDVAIWGMGVAAAHLPKAVIAISKT